MTHPLTKPATLSRCIVVVIVVVVAKMPAQLSKFSFDAPCMDYTHPWTDSCINSTAGLGLHSLQESLRIYTTVYIVRAMRKKVLSIRFFFFSLECPPSDL